MDHKIIEKYMHLRGAFTPAAPIDKKDLFAGRLNQIASIIDAINEKGKHAVIYGERGVGKTSLANILEELIPDRLVLKINCDNSDNYERIWQKILKRMHWSYKQEKMGFTQMTELKNISLDELFVPNQQILPDDVIVAFERFPNLNVLILDEFDRITDARTKTLLADTLKTFSDRIPEITLIFVGVARSVHDLIGEHQSIERNLKQVHVPRMSLSELAEIIEKGLKLLKMSIDETVKNKIIRLSQGFPHYTHLLSKHSAKQAIDGNRDKIIEPDFVQAVQDAINDTQESIRDIYYKATMATKRTIFPEVLLACALAPEDDRGTFRPADVEEPLSKIIRKAYKIPHFASNLSKLCSSERGPVLEKLGSPKRYRYRFVNPLMKPFVLLQAYNRGLVDKDLLKIYSETS